MFRVARHEKRIGDCFERGDNGYWTTYRRYSSIYCPEFSTTCILDDQSNALAEEDPLRKASKLIKGALRFRERVLTHQIEPDFEGKKPLDMGRYNFLFSRLLVTSLKNGSVVHEIVDVPASDHIIVAIDSVYYRLQVICNQQVLTTAELHQQLTALMHDARAQLAQIESDRFPFGLLTTIHDKQTIALLDELKSKSQPTMEQLDNALFLVAIDIHDRPQSWEKIGRTIHRQNFHNRDFRRSMQIIVAGNGQAGITGDPNAGIGGGFVAKFLDELAKDCRALEGELQEPVAPKENLFQRLRFDFADSPARREKLAALNKQVYSQFYDDDCNTVFRIDNLGKKEFGQLKVSADAAIHAALHLAFKRCFDRVPDIGNFIGLRSVQHGEIYRYNSTTPQMKQFATETSAAALAAALQEHKVLIKRIKQADDELYQCQMLLVTLYFRYEISTLGCIALLIVLSLFISNFNRRFVNQDMWVSHIPEFPGVALTGRPGVKLAFLQKPCFAGHYMIFDHHTMICFVTNPGRPSHYGHEARFAAALRDALTEVHSILKSHSGQDPKVLSAKEPGDAKPVGSPALAALS